MNKLIEFNVPGGTVLVETEEPVDDRLTAHVLDSPHGDHELRRGQSAQERNSSHNVVV